jgi:hypothetical protein
VPDETFTVVLEDFVGMAGGASTVGTGTIVNDDVALPPPPPPPAGATPVPALTGMGAGALSALLLAARAAGRHRVRKNHNPPEETP